MPTGMIVCADPKRQAALRRWVTGMPGGIAGLLTYATVAEAAGALASGTPAPGFAVYSLAGGGNALQGLPELKAALPDVPVIVEFPKNVDDPKAALDLLRLGAFNVVTDRIARVNEFRDMILRGVNGTVPYPTIRSVPRPQADWGFMSMTFEPGDEIYREYLSAIRLVMDLLGLTVRRVDEIDPRPLDLRQRIHEAIGARSVLIAQVSAQTSNVMYEIGYADALNKDIIVLWRTGSSPIPAVLKGFVYVSYSTATELALKLFFGFGGTGADL